MYRTINTICIVKEAEILTAESKNNNIYIYYTLRVGGRMKEKMEEKMEESKKGKNSRFPNKFSLYMRIVISVYLIYIVYSLRDVNESYEGSWLLFFFALIVLFGIVAIVVGATSLYALIKGKYEGGAMDRGIEEKENK